MSGKLPSNLILKKVLPFTIALGAGALVASMTMGGTASAEDPKPDTYGVVSDFPRNAYGQTYGSSAAAESPDELPDLVAVLLKDGTQAFVRGADYAAVTFPAVPAGNDPVAFQEAQERAGALTLDAYDTSGQKVIGTWSSGGRGEPGVRAGVIDRDGSLEVYTP